MPDQFFVTSNKGETQSFPACATLGDVWRLMAAARIAVIPDETPETNETESES